MKPWFTITKKRQSGFTLLEAIIALMIVSLALPAMVTLVVTQLDGAASIRDKTYAYWVAENELTRFKLLHQQKVQKRLTDYNVPEKDAGVTDLAGLRWQWQLKTINMESMPVPGFRRLEISVRLLGRADGISLGRTRVDDEQPALAVLTGYISDPEFVQIQTQ